ncbi:MmgE/PrpD family protein [Lysobacter sp. A378]
MTTTAPNPMPRLTEPLIAHAATLRYKDLSPAAIAATKKFIMDSVAVGIAGSGPQVPLTTDVRAAAAALGSGNEARVWVTGEPLPTASAALVNGFQIHNQEFDCVHMPAVVHPMAVILSTLVAVAEQHGGIDGKRLITAVAIAVDVATLIGISGRAPMRFFRPAMCGALGAAAGIAHLHQADAETLQRALGLTYSHLSGTMQAHVEGSPTLALQIGLNGRAASTAWALASHGFPAPRDWLEGPFGYLPLIEGAYDTAPALAALAAGQSQVEQISHKVFPTGGAAHACLDMLGELREREGLELDDIESIQLQAPPLVRRLVARPYVDGLTPSYARLCLPYLVASLMIDGRVGLDTYAAAKLGDPRRAAFAGKLQVVPNACDDPNALVPQSLVVTLRTGAQLHNHRDAALGSPQRPLSREQQLAKFHHCLDHAARPFDAARRAELLSLLDRLEALDDVRRLVDCLIAPG